MARSERRYQVRITRAALREIERIDQKRDRQRILGAIGELAQTPRPPGVVKLVGASDAYRVRVGNFRIIYTIADDTLVVLVIKVGDRRDVYE